MTEAMTPMERAEQVLKATNKWTLPIGETDYLRDAIAQQIEAAVADARDRWERERDELEEEAQEYVPSGPLPPGLKGMVEMQLKQLTEGTQKARKFRELCKKRVAGGAIDISWNVAYKR